MGKEKLGVIIELVDENRWEVRDDRNGYKIGEIKFFKGFEQYCFFPVPSIIPHDYLLDIIAFMTKLNYPN